MSRKNKTVTAVTNEFITVEQDKELNRTLDMTADQEFDADEADATEDIEVDEGATEFVAEPMEDVEGLSDTEEVEG